MCMHCVRAENRARETRQALDDQYVRLALLADEFNAAIARLGRAAAIADRQLARLGRAA